MDPTTDETAAFRTINDIIAWAGLQVQCPFIKWQRRFLAFKAALFTASKWWSASAEWNGHFGIEQHGKVVFF